MGWDLSLILDNSLETINQRPPSYSVNFAFNENSLTAPPKYEDLIINRMSSVDDSTKSSELSKV